MNRTIKVLLRCFARKLTIVLSCSAIYVIVSLMTTIITTKPKLVLYDTLESDVNHTKMFLPVLNFTETTSEMPFKKYRFPHSYMYIHNPSKTCNFKDSSLEPFLVILVKSNVRNFDNRIAIRSTWGNISDTSVRVAFLLGDSPFLRDYIKMEHALYNDIIQENFFDNYYNNTLKTIMGFNWCLDNCKKTAYFFFVDDDYLVNTRLLLDHVKKIAPKSIFTGCVWTGARPNRKKWKKWYVSPEDYPNKVWPPYATGGSYLISHDYALKMRHGFRTIKPLYIDDVYMGIIAKQLKIKLTNDGRFHPYYNLGRIHQLFSIHHFESPRKLYTDWEPLKNKLRA